MNQYVKIFDINNRKIRILIAARIVEITKLNIENYSEGSMGHDILSGIEHDGWEIRYDNVTNTNVYWIDVSEEQLWTMLGS